MQEDEDGNPHSIDDNVERDEAKPKEFPDRRVDGIEMCQDYRMDRCTRGDRCKFSHGEDDSDEKKARLERERLFQFRTQSIFFFWERYVEDTGVMKGSGS